MFILYIFRLQKYCFFFKRRREIEIKCKISGKMLRVWNFLTTFADEYET